MKQILINIFQRCNYLYKKIINFKRNYNEPTPIYVNHYNKGLKIHLGAGDINIQGWINIDARSFKHTHLLDHNFELKEFKNETISEIYLCHVLEHFSFQDSKKLLEKLYKKLILNGLIRISVPDFKKLKLIYNKTNNLEKIKFAIMGGQNYEDDFHKSIYDFKILSELLKNVGFRKIVNWHSKEDFGIELEDWSNGKYNINKKKIKISLNLKAIK
jgi:predicted SAM-dependent methyltransferase